MQREKKLYNVDNRHQCLRDRGGAAIVRFFQYAPHFYGCTLCGQYHICHLCEKTCVVVTDAVSQRLTCQYSGQLLHQSEALVPNVYDEGNDDAPLASTTQSHGLVGGDGMCYTNMGRNKRARHNPRQEVLVTTVTKTVYQPQASPPSVAIAADDLMLSNTAPEETGYESENDEGGDHDHAGAENNNKTYHSNYAYWNGYFAYLTNGGGGGGGAEETATQLHIEKEIDTECVSVVKRESGATQQPPTSVFRTDIVTPLVTAEIDETVESLVRLLLRTQKKSWKPTRPVVPLEQSRVENRMVAQLQCLARTLALLVYNSPVLQTIHTDQRKARNHRAQVFAPEQVIPPRNLCVALLFSLLTEAYCDRDHCDQTVLWWSANPWLAHLARSGVIERVLAEADRRVPRRHALFGDRERMATTVIDVKDALAHYQGHAFWVRNFILSNK